MAIDSPLQSNRNNTFQEENDENTHDPKMASKTGKFMYNFYDIKSVLDVASLYATFIYFV